MRLGVEFRAYSNVAMYSLWVSAIRIIFYCFYVRVMKLELAGIEFEAVLELGEIKVITNYFAPRERVDLPLAFISEAVLSREARYSTARLFSDEEDFMHSARG